MSQKKPTGELRVTFDHPPAAHIMAIDGTWRRACLLLDVSESGATLAVEGAVEGLTLKQFFLLLSSTGLAYRRCELDWINGDRMGLNFLRRGKQKEGKEPAELL
jgi:hypothetical protein